MRNYSEDETRAFALAGLGDCSTGVAQHAGGDWWPNELEKQAAQAAYLVPHLRMAAAALRREIAVDPITAPGVRSTQGDGSND